MARLTEALHLWIIQKPSTTLPLLYVLTQGFSLFGFRWAIHIEIFIYWLRAVQLQSTVLYCDTLDPQSTSLLVV